MGHLLFVKLSIQLSPKEFIIRIIITYHFEGKKLDIFMEEHAVNIQPC